MNNKKFVRIVCIILCALMVLGLLTSLAYTGVSAVSQAEIDALEEQRQEIRNQQDAVREQLNALKSEQASVIEKKAALDAQNELNRQDIEIINEQIAIYDALIEAKSDELNTAIENENEQYSIYCSRIRSMEENGALNYVSFIFQADSLTDLLSRITDVSDIIRFSSSVRDDYIAAREVVETKKGEYEEIRTQQGAKQEELLAEKAVLEQQIESAYLMIAELENDIEAYTAAYEENELLEVEVQNLIDKKVAELEAQKKAEEEARRKAEEEAKKQQQQQQQQQSSGSSSGGSTSTGSTSYSGSGLYWPLSASSYITSRFGYRIHPIFGTTKYHSGIDIAANSGCTITAAASGTVAIAEYSSSYGNYVVVSHSNGTSTLYAHMSSIAVTAGSYVNAGSTIGYVGSTGYSTGPHLHFEVRVNGSCVDPLGYFTGMSFSYASDA